MKHSESESIKNLEKQINEFELLVKAAKFMPFIFGGIKKVKELKNQVKVLRTKLTEMKEIPDLFNEFFSKYGWIAYDSMNMEFMKSQINLAKKNNYEEAVNKLNEYYDHDRIKYEILLLNRTEMTRIRIPLIELAFTDYKENRLHAMIPIVLMMIDGIVNDVVGKGFHSESEKLDAWDCITTIDNGLEVLQNIFRKGRFKTRTDAIEEPYRNGILHGLDLGYANQSVAIKCWHYLFVIRDWAQAKITEDERHSRFVEANKPPDMEKVFDKLQQNKVVKKAIEAWKPKEYSEKYIQSIHENGNLQEDVPEYVVIQFFKWLGMHNYKELSELFWENSFRYGKTRISSIKQEYHSWAFKSFQFKKIINEAPAITEAYVNAGQKVLEFRLIYESKNDGVAIPCLENGRWKIVWIKEVDQ